MKLSHISLVSAAPEILADFYVHALGFHRLPGENIRLGYGDSEIEIRGYPMPGRAMPAGSASNDLFFQHFAMIVNDIDAACEKLNATGGFTAISTQGPVQLPASSGGVTAFKFRDPEGHPLEFIEPLKAAPRRIDHTAIVVQDSNASIVFYAAYGLTRQGGSLNSGAEQAALDGLNEPIVTVTRLAGPGSHLAVELLCYHQPKGAPPIAHKAANDAWATKMIFSGGILAEHQDPDGHDIEIIGDAK